MCLGLSFKTYLQLKSYTFSIQFYKGLFCPHIEKVMFGRAKMPSKFVSDKSENMSDESSKLRESVSWSILAYYRSSTNEVHDGVRSRSSDSRQIDLEKCPSSRRTVQPVGQQNRTLVRYVSRTLYVGAAMVSCACSARGSLDPPHN